MLGTGGIVTARIGVVVPDDSDVLVLQCVQHEFDVRRLGHLVPTLHAHDRSALPPLSRIQIRGGCKDLFQGTDQSGTTEREAR
jgi:hypothetical protein